MIETIYSNPDFLSRHFDDYFDPVTVIADNASYRIDDYDEYRKYHNDISHAALTGAYFMGDDAYLEHHGVKGMHWGVRKDDRYGGKTAQEVSRETAAKEGRKKVSRQEYYKARKQAISERFRDERNDPDRGKKIVGMLVTRGVMGKRYFETVTAIRREQDIRRRTREILEQNSK